MERISSEVRYKGAIATVRTDRFRYDDGSESDREVVEHPGAVAVIAIDREPARVWLVRQPREAVGEEALLELPAGKLDVEGESRIDCAKRELVEEIGREGEMWSELKHFYTSPGFAQEEVTLFLAEETHGVPGHVPDAEERIEVVAWPLAELGEAIEQCHDAKSLIGLMALRDRLA